MESSQFCWPWLGSAERGMRMWAICVKVYEAHVYSGYMGKVGGLNVMLFSLYTACVGQARGSLYSLDITIQLLCKLFMFMFMIMTKYTAADFGSGREVVLKLMFHSSSTPCNASTSRTQNWARHIGQGAVDPIHVSGWCWFCLAANHLLMQEKHHMGRQKHCRQLPS